MVNALLLSVLLAAGGGSAKPKLLILDLAITGGIDPKVAGPLSDAITSEVAARGFFDVLSAREAQTMVGMERQRQLTGCNEEGSCLTELAGALGARFVMSGSLAKLGEAFQLTLQTLDSVKAQPVGRSVRLAKDLQTLVGQLPYAVAEATGTPLPPPPSRVLPYTLIGAGGLALIAGGLVGVNALSQEEALDRELRRGQTGPGTLGTLADYQQEVDVIGKRKTISLTVLAAGAALVGLGVWLNPPEVVSSAKAGVALVPTGNGVALVGVWP